MVNIIESWKHTFARHGITVKSFHTDQANASLWAGNIFLRTMLWDNFAGQPRNQTEAQNWLIWYKKNF